MPDLDVESFVRRDWARVTESKTRYWVERKRRLGPAEGMRASDELRRQALATHPGWPDEAQRTHDLDARVQLSRRLKDASAAVGG